MRSPIRYGLVAAAVLALGAIAYGQTQTLPQIAAGAIHPQNDRVQVVPNGQPSAQSQYASPAQISGTYGYYKSAPSTGFNYSIGTNNITRVAFNPAGTLAVGYVSLPSSPNDGQRVCVNSTQIITALYVCITSTGTGNCVTTNINNAVTTYATANTNLCYLYSSSDGKWDRD